MPLIFYKNPYRNTHLGIWHITESAEDFERMLYPHYNSAELYAISRPERALQWLAARALVARLCTIAGCHFEGVEKDAIGKPKFVTHSGMYLSVSHTGSYAAAIVTDSPCAGLDMEYPDEKKLLSIRERFVHDDESTGVGRDAVKLCQLWAAKEALYKAAGKKGVSFRDDLRVTQFADTGNCGTGTVLKLPFRLHFDRYGDYVLVWIV